MVSGWGGSQPPSSRALNGQSEASVKGKVVRVEEGGVGGSTAVWEQVRVGVLG